VAQFGAQDMAVFFADSGVTATIGGVTANVNLVTDDEMSTMDGMLKGGVAKRVLMLECPRNTFAGVKENSPVVIAGSAGDDGSYTAYGVRLLTDGLTLQAKLKRA